jgi:hypothetical protein
MSDMGGEPSSRDQISAAPAISGHVPASGPRLHAEIRALGVILALDLLIGIWLALHTRGAITTYLAPQLPAIGIGALCWGFLPDAPKKAFGEWLARKLAAPLVYWLVILCGAGGLGASLFVSTVIVQSVDPGVSTTIYIVRGTSTEADREAVNQANELRLNRLTNPQRKHFWITPLGQHVWAHTPTHVSVADLRVIPWIPTVLQYPDDFERMVVVHLLPDDATLPKLDRGDVRLSMKAADDGRRIVEQGVLHEGSTRIAFTKPEALGPETLTRWRSSLQRIEPNPRFVEPMLTAWQRTNWLEARYPLRVNEKLHYELRSAADELLLAGQLTLTNVVTELDISF